MQGGATGIGYGLKYQVSVSEIDKNNPDLLIWKENDDLKWIWVLQARCISDVKADTDHTSFLTGTLSLKEENEVVLNFCLD